MRTRAQAGDPSALDVAYIATTFGVPEPEVQALIDAPTADLVSDFLYTLSDKGKEFDALKADKLKVDVELDNTVRTSETKLKAQKNTVTRVQKEIEELRTKLNNSEAAREALAAEIEQLRASSSGSTAETQTLRQRIDTLEASNRDALALIESKSTEKDRVASELSEQHSKLFTLRREISQLEEKNQTLENAASSQKFKEQSLQQEIDLLKKNNEWHSNELQTRGREHTTFRKDRNARISALERELEDSKASVEALKRTEATLRQRLNDAQTKAEEAFARIAALQEEAARKELGFRTELDGSKRLAELQAQNAATHKARLQEVQGQIDQVKEDAAEEIGRLQAEIETERGDKETAERKIAELELTVERLEQQPRLSRPGTPLRNGHGDPQTPGRAASPSALPGSMRKVVGGLSFTQLYAKYTEAHEELENERRRTSKLSTALDEMITEVETRKPEIEDLKEDQERLENEVLNFSSLLDESNESRDTAVREAQRWQGEAESAVREGQILRQQLRDLSTQVRILLVEIQSRDQGLGVLSAEERLELERAARGELDGSLDDMTSTGRLISERLVIFREISDLQAKNEQLLRLTRELGDKMEGEEAREQARQSAADAEEVESLRQQVERYKDELQATTTTIDSYMKERDMFRRMLQHRGQVAPDADLQSLFGQSIAPGTPQRNSVGPPATPRSKDVEDLNKLLKEQQVFFDQFRTESSTDRRILKEQVDALAHEKNSLQIELARAQSSLTLSSERYEMLQSNFNALRNENNELQKRSQQMAAQAAAQDLSTQQAAEELVDVHSRLESLRNEVSNGKAEKEFLKRIETRLSEENKTLVDERSRLNKMVIDLQNLQNERELSDSENRRRTQARVEAMENELAETKKKLEAEVEDNRKAILRREYEEGQSRTRIDDLVKSLGNVREELVAAKTTRDQLSTRVDELKIELRAAEEKVVALQPRPTPRAEPIQNGEQQSTGEGLELPAEQRLALQVSELRRELELTKAELESARQQIEQYKAISQAGEEELANLVQTSQEYQDEVEQKIVEKDAKISELEQRVNDISSELGTTNSELSELRAKVDDSDRVFAEQKAKFESEATRLRDQVDRLEADKETIQSDVKAQAEIAQQAQQSYEEELQKHAEAARSLQGVRKEYNELRTEVVGAKAEAEAAKTSLERAEESWAEQQNQFERELEEVNRRRQDVDEQNKLLHQQMESFSKELAALRQNRAAAGDQRESTPSGAGSESNYQEVINFLRREKEIVDVQYELSTQEAKRLQQQLDYVNSQLEETRQKLAEERRQSTEKSSSENSTSKLIQTINELNVYRESATTLRNEAKVANEKLQEKAQEVVRLQAEIEPLKARVGELEGELETKEGELKLVQDDRDHWRERTQNIISKYDRVDPAELEEMKKRLDQLEAEKSNLEVEKARLESEHTSLSEQVAGVDDRVASQVATSTASLTERLEKFKTQAKDQDRKRTEKIREITSQQEATAAQLQKAKDDLRNLTGELEQAKTQLEQSGAEHEQTKAALQTARAASSKTPDDDAEEGQVQEDVTSAEQNDEHAALHARISQAEADASEHSGRADRLSSEVQSLQARIQELESQVDELQQQLVTATNNDNNGEQPAATPENSGMLEKLRQDLANAQQEVETLRANAVPSQPLVNAEPAPGEKSVAEQVAEEVAKLKAEFEQQHELAKKELEDAHAQRLQNAKNVMNEKLKERLADVKAKQRDELQAEHQQELRRLTDEHNAAIEKLKADHKAELEKLLTQGANAVAKAEAADLTTHAKPEAPAGTMSISDMSNIIADEPAARQLVQTNSHIKAVLKASLVSQVDKQTAKLKETIATKDAEIERLEEALEAAKASAADRPSATDAADSVPRKELERQLELAKQEKEAAVRQAVDAAEKKNKVQLNMKDIAQAKVNAVQKAAQETPDKPVKDVWEIASKAKPTPKPAAPVVATPGSAKPAVPASPSTAAPQLSPTQTASDQPASAVKASPNPQAATFTPSTSSFADPAAARATAAPKAANAGTGPGALRSLSGLPRAGGAAGSSLPRAGGATGSGPRSRQSSMGGPPNSLQARGALSSGSGLPRGGGIGRGGPATRGLRGGASAANAGQKRGHDGSDGGDVKRTRGGGSTGSS